MKDNKRMNNQGHNNNHRNVTVTFVEDLGSIIRRNSTIPQAVSGELRITNGDVEGAAAVYCSNAAYRNMLETRDEELKLLKEAESEAKDISKEAIAESETSKEAGVVPETTQQNEIEKAKSELAKLREYEDVPFSKKPENYYSRVAQLSRSINDAEAEDLLVRILTGLQLTKAFKSMMYNIRKNVTFIDEVPAESRRLDYTLIREFGVKGDDASTIYSSLHDCLAFDLFIIKAVNDAVYIVCGNVDGVVETFCSTSSAETSMQFITRMMTANSPRA